MSSVPRHPFWSVTYLLPYPHRTLPVATLPVATFPFLSFVPGQPFRSDTYLTCRYPTCMAYPFWSVTRLSPARALHYTHDIIGYVLTYWLKRGGNGYFGTWRLNCLPKKPEEGANRQERLSRIDRHPLRPNPPNCLSTGEPRAHTPHHCSDELQWRLKGFVKDTSIRISTMQV